MTFYKVKIVLSTVIAMFVRARYTAVQQGSKRRTLCLSI